MKRYMAHLLFGYPPDAGAGSGGTPDNSAVSSSASTTEGSVTSGTASDAMIAAFTAASSAEDGDDDPVADGITEPAVSGTPSTLDPLTGAPKTGATGQPGTGDGEAPLTRIQAAVRNARAEVEEKFSWAKDLSADDVNQAFRVVGEMFNDTPGFAARLAKEIGMKLVPLTESAAVVPAASAAGAAVPTGGAFTLPKAKLVSEDGQGAYTETQMQEILQKFETHLESKFSGQLKPLADAHATRTQEEQRAAVRADAHESVKTMMTAFRAMPHFMVDDGRGGKVEHPSILKNLMALPAALRARIGAEASMHRAYTKYLQDEVFPVIGSTATAQVQRDNDRKLRGSDGSIIPAGSTGNVAAPKLRDGDVAGLARHMERLAGQTTT